MGGSDLIYVPVIFMGLGIIGYFILRAEGRRLDRENEKAERERLTPR